MAPREASAESSAQQADPCRIHGGSGAKGADETQAPGAGELKKAVGSQLRMRGVQGPPKVSIAVGKRKGGRRESLEKAAQRGEEPADPSPDPNLFGPILLVSLR